VRVFAHDEGLFARLRGIVEHGLRRGVHRADDVGKREAAVALVLHGARGIALLQPAVGGAEVVTKPGLVAQRPADDAGVVFVALEHADGAVEMRGAPRRFRREGLVLVVANAVALDVGLADHVEAVLVAERIPLGGVGIVAGADGVDVVLLHQADVLHHALARHDLAQIGVPLVAVDAADEHTPAVDTEMAVADFDGAEADFRWDDFAHLTGRIARREEQRVERRRLGGPELRRGDRMGKRHGLRGAGSEFRAADRRVGKHRRPGRVEQRRGERERDGLVGVIFQLSGDLDGGIAVSGIERRAHGEVAHARRLGRPEIDVAEDAAQAPEILILQIGAVAPAKHLDREQVVAGLQVRRQAKRRRRAAVLAEAELLAVDPQIEERVDAIEGDEDLSPGPLGRDGERAPVGRDGIIVLGRQRGPRIRPGIGDVGVDRDAVALHLDIGRYGDGLPGGVVEARLPEAGDAIGRPGDPGEFPIAVERRVERRRGAGQRRGRLHAREAHACRRRGLGAGVEQRLSFPFDIGRHRDAGRQGG